MRKHKKLSPSKKYSQSEVNRIFSRVSPRTLLMLANDGVVECIEGKVDRRGLHRMYILEHIYQIAVAVALSEKGFSYGSIKRLVMDGLLKKYDPTEQLNLLDYMDKILIIKTSEVNAVNVSSGDSSKFVINTISIADKKEFDINSLLEPSTLDFMLKERWQAGFLDGLLIKNPETNKLQLLRQLANSSFSLPIVSVIIVNLPQLAAQIEAALTAESSA